MEQKEALTEFEIELAKLTATTHGRRLFLSSLPLLLHSCATTRGNRHREGDNSGQATAITVDDEKKMGREYIPKMKKDYPPVNDPEAQRYLNNLGQNIVRANGLAGKPYNYTFTLVRSKNINAFALPAGPVYVTTPLFATAESESELAGVLGHEIGHIKARHAAERIDYAQKNQTSNILTTIGGAILGAGAGYGLGKLLCRKRDRKCLQRAVALGGVAGGGGVFLIQKYAFMANSREDEMEADRIGFKTATKAGHHSKYVGKFYDKLYKMEQRREKEGNGILGAFADAMSTHPPGRERVAQMRQLEDRFPSKGKVSSKTFEKIRHKIKKSHLS